MNASFVMQRTGRFGYFVSFISMPKVEKIQNWSGAMNRFGLLFEGWELMSGLNSTSLTQNPA